MNSTPLFDRPRALQCFGSEAILRQVIGEFLAQSRGMAQRLREAVESQDLRQIRQAIHWYRGGMAYLYSPRAELACRCLEQSNPEHMSECLEELEQVLEQLRHHLSIQS